MTAEQQREEICPEVLEYLASQNVVTLATASASALPHAAILLYVNDGIALYFCTRPDTTTAQHVQQNPSVGFAIYQYTPDWSKMKGVQGTGECEVMLSAGDINHVVGLFRGKFSFLSNISSSNLSFFRITPTSIQYINNQQRGTEKAGKTFGIDYQRSMVYNIFRDLPRHEIDTVTTKLNGVQVSPGEIIVRQGAPADKFFIIADGEVEVIREDDGQSRAVAHLESGQFFGEMAILRDTPRTATVKATKPTTLLAMDRDAFRALVAQSLGTTDDFDQVIQRRFEDLAAKSR